MIIPRSSSNPSSEETLKLSVIIDYHHATMAPPEDLPKMTYRFLGRSGLQVSAISLGGWLTYGGYTEQSKSPLGT